MIATATEHALITDFPKWKISISPKTRTITATLKLENGMVTKIGIKSRNVDLMRSAMTTVENNFAKDTPST